MLDLLDDTSTYEKLLSNPLSRKVSTFNSKLSSVLHQHSDLVSKFKTIHPTLRYIYGLPKTHKSNVPLRPIISNIGLPTYKLAEWLASKLSPILGNFSHCHLLNSEDFERRCMNMNFNGKLLSLDVDSLFTKVPTKETLYFLRRRLHEFDLDIPFDTAKFIELIEACITDNVVEYNGVSFAKIWYEHGKPPLPCSLWSFYGIF